MPTKRIASFKHGRCRQRGAALLIMLVILVVGIAAVLVSSLSTTALNNARQKTTFNALAQAKDALIGRAVADLTSPGSLPCPDTNNDGTAESTVTPIPGSCPSYIGRLPWKTLGLPDLRDGSGERLWYALSPNFRDYINSSTPATTNPINSNRAGTLQVYDNSGTTLLTPAGSEAVAIVFAPGDVVASQQRDTANQNIATNYLDIGPNNINNGTFTYPNGPFIAADKTSSFNDRLMIIRKRDIIPTVELRVSWELNKAFAAYLAANGNKYPYPANFTNCTSTSCPSDSITPTCIGKIPATDFKDPATGINLLPAWFIPNNWFDVIYYTAGTNLLPGGGGAPSSGGGKSGKGKKRGGSGVGGGGGGGGSTGCTATFLTVLDTNGATLTSNANALFLLADVPFSSQTRTGSSSSMSSTNLTDYFEDTENLNLDSTYIMPGVSSNDSLYILP